MHSMSGMFLNHLLPPNPSRGPWDPDGHFLLNRREEKQRIPREIDCFEELDALNERIKKEEWEYIKRQQDIKEI